MSATAVEELTTNEAESLTSVEPEAIQAEAAPTAIETAPEAAATDAPAVEEAKAAEQAPATEQQAAPVEQKTASEQAYGSGELSEADRDVLLRTAEHRIEQSRRPFLLACSNRREELRAAANHPKLIATLGKIAFGESLPGIAKPNALAGAGLGDGAGGLVTKMALKSGAMKKTVERVGKLPQLNFNLNYPKMTASETSDEYIDVLGDSLMTANDYFRSGLAERSNDDLAALCAAFDPKANTTSIFEDHIDAALAKISIEPMKEDEKELEEKPAKELAAEGNPEEAKKLQVEQAEKDKLAGREPDKDAKAPAEVERSQAKSAEEEQIVHKMPDEMRELYDDRSYNRV